MVKFVIENIESLIQKGKGDPLRLKQIKDDFEKKKIISISDRTYLEKLVRKYLPEDESLKTSSYGLEQNEEPTNEDIPEIYQPSNSDRVEKKIEESKLKIPLEIQPKQEQKQVLVPVQKTNKKPFIIIGIIVSIIAIGGILVLQSDFTISESTDTTITIPVGVTGSSSSKLTLSTDESSYDKADIISIYGTTDTETEGNVYLSIENEGGQTIWAESVNPKQNGEFSTLLITGGQGWEENGKHTLKAEHGNYENQLTFDFNS